MLLVVQLGHGLVFRGNLTLFLRVGFWVWYNDQVRILRIKTVYTSVVARVPDADPNLTPALTWPSLVGVHATRKCTVLPIPLG